MKKITHFLAVILFGFGFNCFATNGPATKVTVKAGKLKGEVFNAVGKRMSNLKLTISDLKSGKIITESVTDKSGKYAIGILSKGKYFLNVADLKTYEVNVLELAGRSSLKIILPEEYAETSIQELPMDQWEGGFFESTTETGGLVLFTTANATVKGIGIGTHFE